MSNMSLKRPGFVLPIVIALIQLSATYAVAADSAARFDLPAESLDKALRDFAIQTHCQISYEPESVAGLNAPEIRGEFTPSAVLKLLLKGTKLRAVNVDGDMIQVVSKAEATRVILPGADSELVGGVSFMRVGYPGASTASSEKDAVTSDAGTSTEREVSDRTKRDVYEDLDAITVTGSHIRGVKDLATPIHVYTRKDIDNTGSATVQQFLQTLPQNFGGGAGEGTTFSGGGSTVNQTWASGVNLRGLGNDTTLVLVNGHRVAPGNQSGNFVDVSMIPLTAIERIEVVTDGASAIYGSDAVGGVVNVILRTKFEGVSTHVQYGTGDSDSHRSVQAGLTGGHAWSTGSAVLSYQYFDQTPLTAASRSYTQSAARPFDLLPEQVQQAAFASFDQQIYPGLQLVGDAMYSQRSSYNRYAASPAFQVQSNAKVHGYGASLGLNYDFSRQNRLHVSEDYSESDSEVGAYVNAFPITAFAKIKTAIISTNVNVDGVLATLPAGTMHYAVGAQFRHESYGLIYPSSATGYYFPSRNVGAGFAELRIPILGANSHTNNDPALEVSVADRQEHYSDFGSTNNPEFGVLWRPLAGLKLRATWGTSFNAPQLFQLNPIPAYVSLQPLNDPAKGGNCTYQGATNSYVGGCSISLLVGDGNPHLGPQDAKTWTLGLDYIPANLSGLEFKLTYFDIKITNKIGQASSLNGFLDLANASLLGPEIVQLNPSAALVQQLVSQPTYANYYNSVGPSDVELILNNSYRNLSTYKTRGLDFGLRYKTELAGKLLEAGIDGTYIVDFDNRFTSTAPTVSILNTIYNPTDLRLRASAMITKNALSGGLYLNFVNSYTNKNFIPSTRVASWTTADAVINYELHSKESYFDGISLSLNVINLTGRDPPLARNAGYPINYDGANASPLGRFLSFRIAKRW